MCYKSGATVPLVWTTEYGTWSNGRLELRKSLGIYHSAFMNAFSALRYGRTSLLLSHIAVQNLPFNNFFKLIMSLSQHALKHNRCTKIRNFQLA